MSHGPDKEYEQLRVSGLHAFYGESHILHGIDMVVHRGELVTLLGRNGAGRTTTLKAIMNMVGRRTGSIMVNGEETMSCAPHHIARLGVGYCPEHRGIFSSLNVQENLTLPPVVRSGGMRRRKCDRCCEILRCIIIHGHLAVPVQNTTPR